MEQIAIPGKEEQSDRQNWLNSKNVRCFDHLMSTGFEFT